MFKIEQISSAPKQKKTLVLADGSQVVMEMYFAEMQYGWFIRELTYQDFTLKGLRITNSPNMLYQFKNKIPFGLACFSKDNREPMLKQDFSSGASVLYILSEEEVEEYAELLSGQV